MSFILRCHLKTICLIILLIATIVLGRLLAQGPTSIVEEMRARSSEPNFQQLLQRASVSLNFESSASSGTLAIAIVPVKEHWSETLNRTGQAIVGAIYIQGVPLRDRLDPQSLIVATGLYAIEARRLNQSVRWVLRRANGSTATSPQGVGVQTEPLGQDTPVPRAVMSSSRCCFEDDRVRHCGLCN